MKNIIIIILTLIYSNAFAAKGDLYDENILWTKHNLSKNWPGPAGSDPRTVKAQTEDEICIFCHTPHAASNNIPIWNRNLSKSTYDTYKSTSLDSTLGQPQGTSRLCLTCHDGTIGMGEIVNAAGSGYGTDILLQNNLVTMPEGEGKFTGYTRLLGTNLTNDHPISFVFDNKVVNDDGELILPDASIPVEQKWSTYLGVKRYPLNFTGTKEAVQCTSCHNPHTSYEKFLRAPIYQEIKPVIGRNAYDDFDYPQKYIVCLSCHKVESSQWLNSTHAQDDGVLNSNAERVIRKGAQGKTVWQVACLACHDTHTVQGAVRITRNGASSPNGLPAIENTCFMCHASNSYTIPIVGGIPLMNDAGNSNSNIAPYIRDQFEKDKNLGGSGSAMNLKFDDSNPSHEPVFVKRHQEGVELKSPNPPTDNEFPPGTYSVDKTHIECVDCHNPHQVEKKNRLKGIKGVAINRPSKLVYKGSTDTGCFSTDPSHDNICDREPYVYEVCLRCHGNSYSEIFVDSNGIRFPDDTYRRSDPSAGLPANSNFSLKGFSNKQLEFNPLSSMAANSPPNRGNTAFDYNTAFHPVAYPGRNVSRQLFNQLRDTFNLTSPSQLGNLTIQCTDCHNNDDFPNSVKGPITGLRDGTSFKRLTDKPSKLTTSIENNPGLPQGPHGSDNIRLLRGNYNADLSNPPVEPFQGLASPRPSNPNWFALCFKCHNSRPFLTDADNSWTNFYGCSGCWWGGSPWDTDLHFYHIYYSNARCHECHMNIHSNVQAINTIYGDGNNHQLPPDGNTHLINFNPASVTGDQSAYPRWWYDSSLPGFRCNLRCHGVTMVRCAYQFGVQFGPGPNGMIFWPRFCT